MDLSTLHAAVRSLVRDGSTPVEVSTMTPALRALQRRLASVDGEIARLTPPAMPPIWAKPAPRPTIA